MALCPIDSADPHPVHSAARIPLSVQVGSNTTTPPASSLDTDPSTHSTQPTSSRLHVFTYPPDQYHPDKNAGSAHATDMFKKVSRAKVRVEKTPCVPVDLSYPHTPHMCSATPRASTQNMNSCWHAVFSQAPIGNRGSNRGSKLYLPARPRPPPLPKGCCLTLRPIGLNLCARRVLGHRVFPDYPPLLPCSAPLPGSNFSPIHMRQFVLRPYICPSLPLPSSSVASQTGPPHGKGGQQVGR